MRKCPVCKRRFRATQFGYHYAKYHPGRSPQSQIPLPVPAPTFPQSASRITGSFSIVFDEGQEAEIDELPPSIQREYDMTDTIDQLLAAVPPELNLDHEVAWPHRKFFHVKQWRDEYLGMQANRKQAPRVDAELVSSECEDGQHAPVIDIDLPCRLVPSATEGHFHLYIDKQMPWVDYTKLLNVLVEVGIVEREYANMSKKDGASFVRLPEKPKVVSPYVRITKY